MEIDPVRARLNPSLLGHYLNPDWKPAAHLQYLGTRIREAVTAKNGRLIVCMPPGHGKSRTVSIMTPLWLLELWPHIPIAVTSYGHEKAMEWGAAIRDTIRAHGDKLLTRLKQDSKAKHRWHTPEGGGVYCTGVGGALTGFRAGFGVVDDPVKDRQEADSEVYRERAWSWFNEVFLTRLHPDASAMVVQTRWNEDDLAGRLIQQGGWEVISFPYFAEEDDALGREEGAPLWPEYGFTAEWGEKQRQAIGSYSWAALYQQRPSPVGGSIFRREHFRYFRQEGQGFVLERPGVEPRVVPASSVRVYQACDTALTGKTTSDWTVCLTFGITPMNEVLILEVARARLDVPEQMGFLMAQRFRWGPVWQGVEEKASGYGLIQEAARQGKPFKILKPGTVDKVTRTGAISVLYENGRVYHRKGSAWLNDFEAELLVFPNGAHDDQVDCVAYAGMEVSSPVPRVVLI